MSSARTSVRRILHHLEHNSIILILPLAIVYLPSYTCHEISASFERWSDFHWVIRAIWRRLGDARHYLHPPTSQNPYYGRRWTLGRT
jgi:hypothetical protein